MNFAGNCSFKILETTHFIIRNAVSLFIFDNFCYFQNSEVRIFTKFNLPNWIAGPPISWFIKIVGTWISSY